MVHTIMKLLTTLLSFILIGNAVAAYTPISVKGQNQTKATVTNLQVANNNATLISAGTFLLDDCGSSNNLLANCGFEHSTPATGWTLASGTSAAETSNVKQGKQSLKLTLSAQALNFKQTSTLNATAFADGVNGSISISVKTTVANVYLCRTDSVWAVVASTDGTKITNCVLAPNNGKWSDLVMPIILGATQNGLALVSLTPTTAVAVNVTGDVFVDSGILEAGLKTQVASNIGPWITGTCTSTWTANTATTCKHRQVGENLEIEFKAATSGAPTATQLLFNMPTGYTIDTSKMSTGKHLGVGVAADNAGNVTPVLSINGGSTSQIAISGIRTASGTNSVPTDIGGPVTQAVPFTFGASDYVSVAVSVPVTSLAGSSSVYTVPSDSFSTDSNILSHKTSALTSASNIGDYVTYSYAASTNTKTICGTAPSTLPTSANGFLIFTRAYNAPSTCGNPARVEIKIGNAGTKYPVVTSDVYGAVGKSIPTDTKYYLVGSVSLGSQLPGIYDESTGVLVFDLGLQSSLATVGSVLKGVNDTNYTSGYLVVNAQKAKDSIIGSFAEVVTSIGTTSPDIQSVYFASAGACTTGSCTSNNLIGNKITSVTWSSLGVYNVNGIDGTKYNCTGSAFDPVTSGNTLGLVHDRASSTSSIAKLNSSVGAVGKDVSKASVICIGKP